MVLGFRSKGLMICKLCLQDKPLQNSHIVPEFFYKPSYDKKHQIYARIGRKLADMPPLQKGLREHLLCWDCEQKLSPYEKYNRETLYGGVQITGSRKENRIELTGLNYQRVRVFYLSLLWRMSIASHRFWKEVDLGPHQERVRELVLQEDPGEPHDYGVYCIAPLFDGQLLTDFILQPDFKRNHSGRFYRLVLGGFLFMFYVSAVRLQKVGEQMFIQKDGSWIIPVRNAQNIDFLKKEAKRIGVGRN
jgi:hypothetical protein